MCQPPTEYVTISVEIPEHLLKPVPISDMRPTNYKEVADLATLHLGSAEMANAQIQAIADLARPESLPGPM